MNLNKILTKASDDKYSTSVGKVAKLYNISNAEMKQHLIDEGYTIELREYNGTKYNAVKGYIINKKQIANIQPQTVQLKSVINMLKYLKTVSPGDMECEINKLLDELDV